MFNHNQDPQSVLPDDKRIPPIQPSEVGQRLDRYLTAVLTRLSRTTIQQLITDEAIHVNGRPSKPGYALRSGDEVQVLREEPQPTSSKVTPQHIPLDIVYEDSDLLVINKAAGMVVHPAAGHFEDTLVNALVAHYPDLGEAEDETRPGIVHRLDRDTSGLMIVAKNTRTQAALIEQMKQHEITKRYLALVAGVVALDQGSIDAPIGRNQRHRQQMAITAVNSREARTHFRVLQRFARHTLLLVQLETGRTHQIRVHLQAIGHPVFGDPVYGPHKSHISAARHEPVLHRQFLHSYQLVFTHPTTGALLELEAPLPPDLQSVLQEEIVL